MAYWKLFYHVVWATKNREPLITPELETVVYDYLRAKAVGLGAMVFAVNGMPDHVHVVATIPPTIAVAKLIGQIKGVSSAKLNHGGVAPGFAWQDKYGVFSFDEKRLPDVIRYVERQKEHHAEGTIVKALERVGRSARP